VTHVHYQLDHTRPYRRFYRQQDRQRQGQGLMLDIALGVVGAIVGGVLFSFFGATGITGLNLYSMLVAIVGSVVVLWAYHAFAGRQAG